MKFVSSGLGVAWNGERIEQLSSATDAYPVGRRRDAVALLAEDDALTWRDHFPERREMTVLPAVAEELPHGGLVFIEGEECFGIGRRTPERDQCEVRPVGEVETADESRGHR